VPREQRRILNEWRENRITVDFMPSDGGDDDLSDTCDRLYRADEQNSRAEEAMDNAYAEGIQGGQGAWRLTNERIRLEPIYEADATVFWDPNAKRADKSDAEYCFVLTSMPSSTYKDKYDDDPDDWGRPNKKGEFEWYSSDLVYIAEYFVRDEAKKTVLIFRDIDGTEHRHDEDALTDEDYARFDNTGTELIGEKVVRKPVVKKAILSGGMVLEKMTRIAGRHIPVVPFYAERSIVDGVERCRGMVRNVKDAVRVKNLTVSGLAYLAAQSGTDKPIFTTGQMPAHLQEFWKNDAKENYAYLLTEVDHDAEGNPIVGPVGQKTAPQIPPTMAALIQQASADIEDILGNQAQGDEYNTSCKPASTRRPISTCRISPRR